MIIAELQDNITIVTFSVDRLDALNFREFKERIREHIADGARLLIDIEALKFIDSSGLGAILSVLRDLKKTGGDLKICSPLPAIEVLFELVRMQKITDVYKTRDAAIAAFNG